MGHKFTPVEVCQAYKKLLKRMLEKHRTCKLGSSTRTMRAPVRGYDAVHTHRAVIEIFEVGRLVSVLNTGDPNDIFLPVSCGEHCLR